MPLYNKGSSRGLSLTSLKNSVELVRHLYVCCPQEICANSSIRKCWKNLDLNSKNLCVWTRSTKPRLPENGLKKAAEQLEKLNNDCNMTVGLQAKLVFTIGAHVMLRRNIDTNIGLVNGAIGTVLSISKEQIKVTFDHISAPYDVESA